MMHRSLDQMTQKEYDLLIIGGGIYGAAIAWDAQQRGLSVALLEKEDFGHATSANSLRIIHGGLRYIRDGRLKIVRMMTKERRAFMQIAPHLVHPMQCLMPTNRELLSNKFVLGAALALNDLFSFDRNKQIDPQKYLPNGQIISAEACLSVLPGLQGRGVTGAAVWYDGQIHQSERLTLAFVQSAAQAGADVANYVEATNLLTENGRVHGVKAVDQLTGCPYHLRAKLVVNAAGPWAKSFLGEQITGFDHLPYQPSIAMNLVTRQIIPGQAVGIPNIGKTGQPPQTTRTIFITPWHNYSLVGTAHFIPAEKGQTKPTEQDIQLFIDEINASYPPAALKREDVLAVHSGTLPADAEQAEVNLLRESLIIDHQKTSQLEGLITVVGVKYTMARYIAEEIVDQALVKLQRPVVASQTLTTPLYGGRIPHFTQFLAEAIAQRPTHLSPAIIERLVYNYGSEYNQVLELMSEHPTNSYPVSNTTEITKAEILYAIRKEMVIKLEDILYRRTGLGFITPPDSETVQACTALMEEVSGRTMDPLIFSEALRQNTEIRAFSVAK